MTDFAPIDPEGKTVHELIVEVAQGVNKTHECVHIFQRDQAARDAEAAQKRAETAAELRALQGDVRGMHGDVIDLKVEVEGVKDAQTIANGRVTRLAKTIGAEAWSPGEKPARIRGVAGWGGWKAAGAGFGVLSGVVLAYKIAAPLLEPIFRAIHHAIMAVPA